MFLVHYSRYRIAVSTKRCKSVSTVCWVRLIWFIWCDTYGLYGVIHMVYMVWYIWFIWCDTYGLCGVIHMVYMVWYIWLFSELFGNLSKKDRKGWNRWTMKTEKLTENLFLFMFTKWDPGLLSRYSG